ncbi:MAG: phospholipase D-like domain-containing protein [Chloroflexi bacterium]|nr:phospholipase D-like domain-containing protein [Chloroflexota bacterium]
MQRNGARSFRRKIGRALITTVVGCFPLILLAALALEALWRPPLEEGASRRAETREQPAAEEAHFQFGRGFIGAGWRVYFNEPDPGAEQKSYAGGIEMALINDIKETRKTLAIAAFELNSEPMYEAILAAHRRGVAVRIVTDDEHGLHDAKNDALRRLQQAGVALRDDGRSGLMHNKFMIMDGQRVWTGSLNYTVNGVYRNNNNILVMESAAAARAYQAEFDEMFDGGQFGPRSPDDGAFTFALGAGDVNIMFAPEADEVSLLIAEIEAAARSIHLLAFVFSLEELSEAILKRADDQRAGDFIVKGIFEKRNSTASWSQLPALHCAGADMRQDGSPFVMHHKVIIIDEHTVITGSFNYSKSAAERNDENIVVIRNETIAALYLDEWRRVWDSALPVARAEVDCA